MPNTNPESRAHTQEALTRNEYACQLVAGFRSAMPAMAEIWDYLNDALNDVRVLDALIKRLIDELDETRRHRANLLAAMRATLAAHDDHEPDPLWYLRDELEAAQAASSGPQGDSGRRG